MKYIASIITFFICVSFIVGVIFVAIENSPIDTWKFFFIVPLGLIAMVGMGVVIVLVYEFFNNE